MLRDGIGLAVAGAWAGLLVSAVLAQRLTELLFGVQPLDLVTYAGASLLLVGIAALACYLPARRATRVDPLTALRCE